MSRLSSELDAALAERGALEQRLRDQVGRRQGVGAAFALAAGRWQQGACSPGGLYGLMVQ